MTSSQSARPAARGTGRRRVAGPGGRVPKRSPRRSRRVGLVPVRAVEDGPWPSSKDIRRDGVGDTRRGDTRDPGRRRGGSRRTSTRPCPPNADSCLGNGSMVAAVRHGHRRRARRGGQAGRAADRGCDAPQRRRTAPLVVGDRLDTDIEGANAVGADSLLVLTGVSTATTCCVRPRSNGPRMSAPRTGGARRPGVEESGDRAEDTGGRVEFDGTICVSSPPGWPRDAMDSVACAGCSAVACVEAPVSRRVAGRRARARRAVASRLGCLKSADSRCRRAMSPCAYGARWTSVVGDEHANSAPGEHISRASVECRPRPDPRGGRCDC